MNHLLQNDLFIWWPKQICISEVSTCKLKTYQEETSELNKYQNSYLFHKLCKNLQLVRRKNCNLDNISQYNFTTQNHAILSIVYQYFLHANMFWNFILIFCRNCFFISFCLFFVFISVILVALLQRGLLRIIFWIIWEESSCGNFMWLICRDLFFCQVLFSFAASFSFIEGIVSFGKIFFVAVVFFFCPNLFLFVVGFVFCCGYSPFRCEPFPFAASIFSFATGISLLPWAFFFCLGLFLLRRDTFEQPFWGNFLATESPLEMIKSAFYLILKSLFVFKIFKFLSRLFGHAEKRLDQKDKVNFKIYDKTIAMHILSNISRNKVNQIMKFGQLREYKVMKFFIEKSSTKCGGKTIPRQFSVKWKSFLSQDQQLKVLYSLLLCLVEGCLKILERSHRPLAFTSYKAILKNKKSSGTSLTDRLRVSKVSWNFRIPNIYIFADIYTWNLLFS